MATCLRHNINTTLFITSKAGGNTQAPVGKDCSFLVLLASLLFHRCVMPRAHDDCKFRDEWLVQDKYKEWVDLVKDGDPRLARCQFSFVWNLPSSIIHGPCPWPCMIASNANSRMNSLLLVSWGILESQSRCRDTCLCYSCVVNIIFWMVTHSLIWRPSRVADTPPLLPISRYGYCLFVADVCLCSEVLQPGGSRSSSGSGSM